MGALFESFLGFLVRVRGALDGEFLDAGRERNRAGDAGARALDGVGDFAGRLVYDPEVISLEADSNTLSLTKNNCLLMVVKIPLPVFPKADADNSNCAPVCNNFFQEFYFISRHFLKTDCPYPQLLLSLIWGKTESESKGV